MTEFFAVFCLIVGVLGIVLGFHIQFDEHLAERYPLTGLVLLAVAGFCLSQFAHMAVA